MLDGSSQQLQQTGHLMFYLLMAMIGVVFASIFEWTLHKFFMHRPFLGFFKYPFKAHALTHHKIFKADHTYHLIREEDKHTIPMAWWNGAVIIAIGTAMTIPFSLLFGSWWVSIIISLEFTIYYCTYEYIHWCMHLPKKRRVEFSWIFYRLNGHHVLHHRYMHRNFNVVLPLADLLFGTLLLRSSMGFPQIRGYAVPDVQPIVN